MNKPLLLVYNPQSGNGQITEQLSTIINNLTKKGFDVTIRPTQNQKDAEQYIRANSRRFKRIVICGGDGMVHEAINGLQKAKNKTVKLGYIPCGTVNDFAHTHDIPTDINDALTTVTNKKTKTIDIGKFNDTYFSYVAAFGIATAVSYDTPQDQKKKLARLAYVLNALGQVDFAHWENNCKHMQIEWDSGKEEADYLYGMVSNSKYIGGMEQFTKDIFDWQDGKLEGLFIKQPKNLTELNTIAGGILRSDFSSPLFTRVQSDWFHFKGEPASWTLDGEYGGTPEEVHAQAVPKAIRLLVQ